MTIHVEEISSELLVIEGDLPLTEAQIDKLVKIVMKRLEDQQRKVRWRREATSLRSEAAPPMPTGD